MIKSNKKRYIYKITNLIDNKCYIGQTNDIEGRINNHKKRSSNYFLKESIKNNGIENFKFNILLVCEYNNADYYERECIKIYNSLHPNGYNLNTGGCKHKECSDLTKKKMSEMKKGQIPWLKGLTKETDERVRKLAENNIGKHSEEPWNKGIQRSDKTKKKISETLKRKIKDGIIEVNVGERNGMYRKKHTEESKRIMSEKRKGKKKTEETIRRMKKSWTEDRKLKQSESIEGTNNPFYGKHHTEETKRKISETKKNAYNSK